MAKSVRVLAIDLGASSGRGIIFHLADGKLQQNVIHRFPNGAVERDGRLYWNLDMLFTEVVKAIGIACKDGKLDGVGIDTWGVDFGFVGKDGKAICDDFRNYRNPANAAVSNSLDESVRKKLFEIAGISDNDFNTTYQLIARAREDYDFDGVEHMLFTPQLLGYMLTDVAVSEPTISSTSGFYRQSIGFDENFLKQCKIPKDILPKSVDTCSVIGNLKEDIKEKVDIDYDLPVIATPGHDTACAVLGVPSQEEYPLFLSSGTWSLFGALEDKPIVNDDAWKYGYTNELAFGEKVRLLRNIMGMWIIQECRRQWISEGKNLDYPQIVALAKDSQDKGAFIDVNDSSFALPCNMADSVKAYVLTKQGIKLNTIGEVARCVYTSLAKAYKDAYDGLVKLTGRKYDKLYIIGGGANNDYLNQIIADTLGIEVSAGPSEASALGNAIGQFVGLGAIKPSQIKNIIMANCDVKVFLPKK
ncbi:MAG: hypothetical protein K2K85_05880 [Clostridia bacterium]|nr:hypothetical protein [Clostridia bacterium]